MISSSFAREYSSLTDKNLYNQTNTHTNINDVYREEKKSVKEIIPRSIEEKAETRFKSKKKPGNRHRMI